MPEPSVDVTVTVSGPLLFDGAVAKIDVSLTTEKVAEAEPKVTLVVPENPDPVIVTDVPIVPTEGVIEETVGTTYVNVVVAEPNGVVTDTVFAPIL